MFVLQVGKKLGLSVEVRAAALVGLFQGLRKRQGKNSEMGYLHPYYVNNPVTDALIVGANGFLMATLTATWSFSWSGVKL